MSSALIRWSDSNIEEKAHTEKIEALYRKAKEAIEGYTLFGYKINLNNPKEVAAVLYLLAEDYNRYHERL